MDKPAALSAEKQRLLAQRLKGIAAPAKRVNQVPPRSPQEPAPLSFAQHQLWVIDQMTPGNPAYNIPVAYRLMGPLNVALLEESFHQIVRRHEVWRTTFPESQGDAIQEVHPEGQIRINIIRLDQETLDEREQKTKDLVAQEAVKPFDLRALPLLRVSLFELGPDDHVLVVNAHHIVSDGVSVSLMFDELHALYRAALAGVPARLPELTVQYADFSAWQKTELAKPGYAPQLEYWRRQLEGELPLLEFAAEKPRPPRQSFAGSSVPLSLPGPLVATLTTLAAQEGCTFFVTILTALQMILSRYAQAEEIVIGTPIANRSVPEVNRSIGNFVNVVALRCRQNGTPSFLELLRRNKEVALDALSNKDIPFEMLVKDLRSHHNPSHNPVFQVLLQVLPADRARLGDLAITPFDFESRATQVDLALHLYEQADGSVRGWFQYCTDLFSAATIGELAGHFLQLLDEIGRDPKRQVVEFPIPALLPPSPSAAPESGPPVAPDYAPPQNSVQSQLAEIWEELLRHHPIGIHDDFFALGGHSLLVARMLATVQEKLGVRVPFGAFFRGSTIEHLSLLMKDRQALQAAESPWVLLNEKGTKAPFFFLHGDFNGGGFFCRTLAQQIGEDRPFYAMHPAGLNGDPIPTTIEDMAALKVQDLRKIQPEGPYILGGYCNGALVAYETARQLEAAGCEPPLVIMLFANGTNAHCRGVKRLVDVVSKLLSEDAVTKQRRFLRWRDKFHFLRGVKVHYARAVADLVTHPPAEQLRRVRNKLARIVRRIFGRKAAALPASEEGPTDHVQKTDQNEAKGRAYYEAFFGYVPQRFGGRVVLLWPQDEKSGSAQGPADGWTDVCNDVELVLVPGEHDSCVARTSHLNIIGEEIGRILAQTETRK
ncbi:MAG: condensation domain-containing protein [Chthoniobacter sp.]|uniref:condensation domain-containing protein n=1 Tax=Chthoniobacter sp. TaxID=2510640 RepID=UPI0032AD8C1E